MKKKRNVFMKTFGMQLRLKRHNSSKKSTIAEFANLAKLDDKYLGKIERGERLPSAQILYNMFHGLGISIDELFKEVKVKLEIPEEPALKAKSVTQSK